MRAAIAKKLKKGPGIASTVSNVIPIDWSEIRQGNHYSVRDVAAMLHCSEDHVLKHIITRGTPGVFRAGRAYRITQMALDAQLAGLQLVA